MAAAVFIGKGKQGMLIGGTLVINPVLTLPVALKLIQLIWQ